MKVDEIFVGEGVCNFCHDRNAHIDPNVDPKFYEDGGNYWKSWNEYVEKFKSKCVWFEEIGGFMCKDCLTKLLERL